MLMVSVVVINRLEKFQNYKYVQGIVDYIE